MYLFLRIFSRNKMIKVIPPRPEGRRGLSMLPLHASRLALLLFPGNTRAHQAASVTDRCMQPQPLDLRLFGFSLALTSLLPCVPLKKKKKLPHSKAHRTAYITLTCRPVVSRFVILEFSDSTILPFPLRKRVIKCSSIRIVVHYLIPSIW